MPPASPPVAVGLVPAGLWGEGDFVTSVQHNVDQVDATERRTAIGKGETTVHTVEHLLAAQDFEQAAALIEHGVQMR